MTSLRPQPSPISLQRNYAIARAVLALAILSALPVRLRAEFVKVSGIDAARVERVPSGKAIRLPWPWHRITPSIWAMQIPWTSGRPLS